MFEGEDQPRPLPPDGIAGSRLRRPSCEFHHQTWKLRGWMEIHWRFLTFNLSIRVYPQSKMTGRYRLLSDGHGGGPRAMSCNICPFRRSNRPTYQTRRTESSVIQHILDEDDSNFAQFHSSSFLWWFHVTINHPSFVTERSKKWRINWTKHILNNFWLNLVRLEVISLKTATSPMT